MQDQPTATTAAQTDEVGLERVVFFSDAVFAIAITLLALEIRLPSLEIADTDVALRQALLGIWPQYLGFVISFLVIGTFWMSHHRKFRLIRRYDYRLVMFNLLLLMGIAFVPFPTAVLTEFGSRVATVLYAGTMVGIGLLFLILWLYASHRDRLIDARLDAHTRRRELLAPLFMIGVFGFSILLAYINDDLAKFSWSLVAATWLFIR